MMPDLSLVTCTADHPVAFALCERWMKRQTFRGSVEWIVSDGGVEPADCTAGQVHLRNPPHADPKRNFLTNLAAGLRRATSDRILLIEHDDWYGPDWLLTAYDLLESHELIGESRAKYYHVGNGRHRICANHAHASLCQTGMFRSTLEWILPQLPGFGSTFVDLHLWKHAPADRCLLPESKHVVGIKGLPGKAGIGMGHRPKDHWPVDADGAVLREWVGDDADVYREMG